MRFNPFAFISNLFDSIGAYFRKLFKKAKDFVNNEIPAAIAVVEALKSFIDSPFVPVITHLIPGELDDVIADKIKKALPGILVKLKIAQGCSNLNSNDAIIQCAISYLKSLDPEARRGKYLDIASTLSEYLTDGKLSWAEIVTIVQSIKNPAVNTSK